MSEENVVILGAGPAGLTAALYAARANLEPLVLGVDDVGGQLNLTNDIENYPGCDPEQDGHFTGLDLGIKMQKQAERFGARMSHRRASRVDFSSQPLRLWVGGDSETTAEEITALTVIICTGSSPRTLDVPGEKELTGRGLSYCATCDGAFFRDQRVVVVGGGDSAIEEGIFLTRFASEVHVVHRRERLRASKILQDRAFAIEKMHWIWDTIVTEVLGEDQKGVGGVRLENVENGEGRAFETDGVFIFIGHEPQTALFEGQIELDDHGYIVTDHRQRTNVEGVYAAGDVQDTIYKQAVTAAGTGCAAAMEAEKFVAELEGQAYPVAH